MDAPEIPADVRRFVDRRIDSVPHLETLLLLWQHPAQDWSEDEVAARLYVTREAAAGLLADLGRLRLLSQPAPDRYRYDAAWDGDGLMTRLFNTYRLRLVQLTKLIHAKTSSEAVRDFARAFRFRDDD